jgi:hypothetical protein
VNFIYDVFDANTGTVLQSCTTTSCDVAVQTDFVGVALFAQNPITSYTLSVAGGGTVAPANSASYSREGSNARRSRLLR